MKFNTRLSSDAMQPSPFSRLLWKDSRELLPLAGTLVLGSTSLQLLIALLSKSLYLSGLTSTLSLIPAALCAAFTVAAGAILFAGEKESETIDLLRRFPTSPGYIVRSKFIAAFLITFLLAVVLMAITVAMVSWKGSLHELFSRDRGWEFLGAFLVLANLLIWGIFFSIITGKVLNSIFLSLFATVVARQGTPYDSIVLGVLLLVIFFLRKRWFYGLPLFSWLLPVFSVSVSFPRKSRSVSSVAVERGTRRSRETRSLLWLEFRRAKGLLICLVVAFTFWGVSLIGAEATLRTSLSPNTYFNDVIGPIFGIPALLLTLGVLIAGISVFSSDQQQMIFRFLSERGVSPGNLFRCRLLVWGFLGLVLPLVLFASFIKLFESLSQQFVSYSIPFSIACACVLVLCIAFTSGLLTSLIFRSKFVAFGVSLITLFLCLTLNGIASPEPDALPVILMPLPFVFLIAARYRLRDWLLERNRFRHWSSFNAVLWIPISLSLISGPLYRIYSIPYVALPKQLQAQKGLGRASLDDHILEAEIAIELRCLGSVPTEVRVSDFIIHPSNHLNSRRDSWTEGTPYGEWHAPLTFSERGWEKGLPFEREWLEKNQHWLTHERVLQEEAGRLSSELLRYSLKSVFPNPNRLRDLAYLHHLMGSRLDSEGKLREGFKHHLRAIQIAGLRWRIPDRTHRSETLQDVYHRLWDAELITAWSFRWIQTWSYHPQQTKEILADAIPQLEKVVQTLPSPSMSTQILAETLAKELNSQEIGFVWERERVKRIGALAINQFVLMDGTHDRSVIRGKVIETLSREPLISQSSSDRISQAVESYKEFLPQVRNDGVETGIEKIEMFGSMCGEARGYSDSRMNRLQMLDLSLALNAWRVEHGSYPTTLQPLVGPYFDELPQVTYSAMRSFQIPFSYFPTGLADELDLATTNEALGAVSFKVPALRLTSKTPFLFYSVVRHVSFVPYEEQGRRRLKMVPEGGWFVSTPKLRGSYHLTPSSIRFLPLVPTELIPVNPHYLETQPGFVVPVGAGGALQPNLNSGGKIN